VFYTKEQMPQNLPQRIEYFREKKLIGKHLTMNFAQNLTGELWSSFMPLRNTIKHTTGIELYSVQLYPPGFFDRFNPLTFFEKWAAKEVSATEDVPEEMEVLTIPDGLYSVFSYTGSSVNAPEVFQQILGVWLPASGYELDNRPHFELLGEKYKNGDPQSEEEIWIPVRLRL
jgi:AraC family transcriptional regulator